MNKFFSLFFQEMENSQNCGNCFPIGQPDTEPFPYQPSLIPFPFCCHGQGKTSSELSSHSGRLIRTSISKQQGQPSTSKEPSIVPLSLTSWLWFINVQSLCCAISWILLCSPVEISGSMSEQKLLPTRQSYRFATIPARTVGCGFVTTANFDVGLPVTKLRSWNHPKLKLQV